MTCTPEQHPCDVLSGPDGQPLLTLPSHWPGLPLRLSAIPGAAERGPFETRCPTMLVARHGAGQRWYRSGGRTQHLLTAPGMIELYPQGLTFDSRRWAGQTGHCIAIHLLPHALHTPVAGSRQTAPGKRKTGDRHDS